MCCLRGRECHQNKSRSGLNEKNLKDLVIITQLSKKETLGRLWRHPVNLFYAGKAKITIKVLEINPNIIVNANDSQKGSEIASGNNPTIVVTDVVNSGRVLIFIASTIDSRMPLPRFLA